MGGEQPLAAASADGDQAGDDEADGHGDDGGTAPDAADRTPDVQAPEAHVDSRTGRPEPFEHAFGAGAHPAEPATSDPSHTATPSPSAGQGEPAAAAPEPAVTDRAATEEP